MKRLMWMLYFFLLASVGQAQQNYIDFEGNSFARLFYKSGRINIKAKNPKISEINKSPKCAKYYRTSFEKFDNIKFLFVRKVANVAAYSNYNPEAQKIKIKIFTSASPGTIVEIQLGKLSELQYPMNVHSQYLAKTTKQNEWEELEFQFSQIPKGSLVKPSEINQLIILFAPESIKKEVFFFDDITGPHLIEEDLSSTGRKRKR